MQDNRNGALGNSCDSRGTVCIDTNRVLDCCRDRDCFEDARVYLTAFGEDILANATNIRTRGAELIWAYVGVDPVPFNNGFYQVTVRYYIRVELEACLGIGKNQCFSGIAVLEKDVVLFGGEGRVASFSSDSTGDYCSVGNIDAVRYNDPTAIVESVSPIILGTKVVECNCGCACCECCEIPDSICACLDGEVIMNSNGPRILVSVGIFSVVRIVRPAQLLVQATDYSVPDKECVAATNEDNPCALFGSMAFPVNQFKTTTLANCELPQKSNGCGCSNR